MKVSVLVPYKPDGGIRDSVWDQIKQWYQTFLPQLELCVGSDDSEPFCRARARNNAARQATGDVFFFVDADVVYDIGLIDRILELLPAHPWIIPFYNGYKLTYQGTKRVIDQGLGATIEAKPGEIEENDTHAGCFFNVVTREWFERIGGMDERFRGWGGEDGALVYTLDTLCGGHYRMNENIYHLWHPRDVRLNGYYQANMDLLIRYRDAMGNVAAIQELLRQKASAVGNAAQP